MADLISKEKENGVHQSTVKVIFLSVFEIGSAFLMSFYFRQFANNSGFPNGGMTWFLIYLGLFVGFSFLAALFIKELQWSGLAAGLSVMASMAVFYDYFSMIFLVFGFLIFLIFIWGIHRLQGELENNLKIKFFRLVKAALPKITLGIAILISLFSYFLFSIRVSSASPEQSGFPISFEFFQSFILKPNEKIIGIFVPDFSFQKPLQIIFSGFLEKQISEKVSGFQNLSASAKENILESAVQKEFTDGLTKFFNYKINVQDAVDKIVYDILTMKFSQLGETAKNFIIIGISVILFLIIQTLFIPINWLFSVVLFIIYSFLLAVDFVNIVSEPRSKEVIRI